VRIFSRLRDEAFRKAVTEAAQGLRAQVVEIEDELPEDASAEDVIVAEPGAGTEPPFAAERQSRGVPVLLLCSDVNGCQPNLLAAADDWLMPPVTAAELRARIAIAQQRALGLRAVSPARGAELIRYEELLYDRRTGFPTLPVMIERARTLLDTRGELTVLYIHFVWYEKIEEIFGWQKLDDVLETTATGLRNFYSREQIGGENLAMVSHVADDDFILFAQVPASTSMAERKLRELSQRLENFLRTFVEEVHGEEIATLCGIYVGASTVFRNPKIRTERLIYRGIREAAQAARGAEQWERARKVTDLRQTIRDEAVFIEYHPIIVTATEEIYGFEALARGVRRELRSPEVLFEVAEEANLVWELSRLLRRRAVEGMINELKDGQFLFINVDPHDFDDPMFRAMNPAELGIPDPTRVVLEITERTAIKDYPRFQEYLAHFRQLGFRFAVDDAGSGYAGLGSIANLAPDYIKLDISLISNIDTNFLKQNLVETMVQFAEGQGATVIAEGVERREEFETVREIGVHLTQGFLFHKPRYSGFPARNTARFSPGAAGRGPAAEAGAELGVGEPGAGAG
jgi:EAL domain-containing protein (putative c-di-GMP-specific phosphodiesterase class I)/GGDEF domain-containing protein